MVIFGLWQGVDAPVAGPRSVGNWMFEYMKAPLEATLFSLLGFFICSAAFRAFRARSLHATLMLVSAIVVILALTSFGDMISGWINPDWPVLAGIRNWLMNVPTVAAKRAIFLGVALSVIATSVRIIFGIEQSYLGRGK